MRVRDASLPMRRILCGTARQSGGDDRDENRGNAEAKERRGRKVHEMGFEMLAEMIWEAFEPGLKASGMLHRFPLGPP